MSEQGWEFRVVWKRDGSRRKVRRFATEAAALRWRDLLASPEPWVSRGLDPDAFHCCSGGPECGCHGQTVRAAMLAERARLPALQFVTVEKRAVAKWTAHS